MSPIRTSNQKKRHSQNAESGLKDKEKRSVESRSCLHLDRYGFENILLSILLTKKKMSSFLEYEEEDPYQPSLEEVYVGDEPKTPQINYYENAELGELEKLSQMSVHEEGEEMGDEGSPINGIVLTQQEVIEEQEEVIEEQDDVKEEENDGEKGEDTEQSDQGEGFSNEVDLERLRGNKKDIVDNLDIIVQQTVYAKTHMENALRVFIKSKKNLISAAKQEVVSNVTLFEKIKELQKTNGELERGNLVCFSEYIFFLIFHLLDFARDDGAR